MSRDDREKHSQLHRRRDRGPAGEERTRLGAALRAVPLRRRRGLLPARTPTGERRAASCSAHPRRSPTRRSTPCASASRRRCTATAGQAPRRLLVRGPGAGQARGAGREDVVAGNAVKTIGEVVRRPWDGRTRHGRRDRGPSAPSAPSPADQTERDPCDHPSSREPHGRTQRTRCSRRSPDSRRRAHRSVRGDGVI